MKKILLATLFTFSSFMLFAQDDTFKGFKLGLTAHPNFGWIKSDVQGIKVDGLRAGFSYGLLGDFYFAENYAFSTAVLLTTINGQTKSEQTSNTGDQQIYKIQYIEIPLKLKLSTSETNGIKFYGEFGLGNGFCVRAKQDVKSTTSANVVEGADIYKNISFYRASLILGAGAEFKVGEKTALVGGLSFDNGFTDIQSGTGTLKNSYLGLNLGVFF
jgi:hypothetical protein